MRGAFVRTLVELAAADRRIVLLTGDLGYMALEPFIERCPDRFFNVGVAEQNMVGIATGLAEAGYVPFVYSIVTFATLRPYEFIRNGPIWHRLPVRIVGVGGGFEYGPQGLSHHGLEDVGIMRVQPGMTVVAPADHQQMATALRATWDRPGPVYYRIGKDDKTTVPGLEGRFRVGHVETVHEGADVALVAMGSVAAEAADAARRLAESGVAARVLVVASVQPPPADDLAAALADVPLAFTVEAHYASGGLGSLVAEVIAERGVRCRLVRCAVAEQPDARVGSQAYLYRRHGLSADAIAATVQRALGRGVTADHLASVVLPAYNQADHIGDIVRGFATALATMPVRHEIVLVPNGSRDRTEAVCAELATELPHVRSLPLERGGWGRAVRHGLAEARGDLLCYTNSARTAPEELTLTILYAATHAGTVVKANRKIREHWSRRLGSLLYNLECRSLFDLSCWDVNGTPKVFPRSCERLLKLTRDDDLIDAEFVWICREAAYPMLEVPVFSYRRFGGRSTTNLGSAARMYWGAWSMRRRGR